MSDGLFSLTVDPGRGVVTSLRRGNDVFPTEYILADAEEPLGEVRIRYRTVADSDADAGTDTEWSTAATREASASVSVIGPVTTVEHEPLDDGPLRFVQRFREGPEAIDWEIEVTNAGLDDLLLGDVALPLNFNTSYVPDVVTTYTERVVRHDHVAGNGSFFYFTRPNGVGPYLVLTPANVATAPEYFERDATRERPSWEGPFTVFLHSLATGPERGGSWRLPHTGRPLAAGATVTFAFRFDCAEDHADVRNVLARNGLLDVVVAPGMVVPTDLTARIGLRSDDPVTAIEAEHPEQTRIRPRGERGGYGLYDIAFDRTGENLVTVHQGAKRTILEFFATPPIEQLIKLRSGFLARKQQYRGPAWYDGLMSNWDMRSGGMTTPDHPLELPAYAVGGSDDPTICKAPTLAEKNAIYPDATEIEAIEYHIEHFVVGKLQRRGDEHPHPFGIYGSDNWHENRNAPGAETGTGGWGREHMWRTFDYTHLIQLYLAMHDIARRDPELVRYADADGYLELAFETAKAFYLVPYSIFMEGWAFRGYCDWAYKQGNFHELKIPLLIEALRRRGWDDRADELRGYWETKVKFMVYDHPYPFGSEMWFDSTAFESTYAVAHYGLEHDIPPDDHGWFDKNADGPGVGAWRSHPSIERSDFTGFLENQAIANMAARGMIEPAWYRLGSDIRQSGNSSYALSYMTPLGGAALLDYAVRYAADPATALRAGYAAQLACFSLVHTGEDYPWWPTADNAGALAWAFNPSKFDPAWMGVDLEREVWPFDGENDSGLAGAIRAARTVLYDDPVLGLVAYGGDVESDGSVTVVTPRDGVRQRLDVLVGATRLHVSVDRDHIRELRIDLETLGIELELESAATSAHEVVVTMEGSHTATSVVRMSEDGRQTVRPSGTP